MHLFVVFPDPILGDSSQSLTFLYPRKATESAAYGLLCGVIAHTSHRSAARALLEICSRTLREVPSSKIWLSRSTARRIFDGTKSDQKQFWSVAQSPKIGPIFLNEGQLQIMFRSDYTPWAKNQNIYASGGVDF